MNDELLRAIRTRKLIEFNCDGHHRVVEPHVYGCSRGADQLLGYQLRGTSASGGLPDWRRFDLASMSSLMVLEETFAVPRPNASGAYSDWDEIYMVVG